MRYVFALAALALAACAGHTGSTVTPARAQATPITAALLDSRRPAADAARDAVRRPVETLAFAGVRPGSRVGEILPAGGYFTRILAVAVGDTGRLYPVVRPDATVAGWEKPALEVAAQYPNTHVVRAEFTAVTFPEPLDVVFTAQNYHDYHIPFYGFGDVAAINRAAFAALKPGGVYLITDHSAIAGTPILTDRASLHRIDQAIVRREVEAAGFVYDGESDALRNPADPRTASIFDPVIATHTDQFIMRFRKPH